jgi:arylsulfatase A-like enzyme
VNVIIIHTDQQRYDSMGCTGNRHAETPHLDALAEQSTLFSRHIVSNTICMPSRASLMTGLYPPGHGVWDNGVPLNRRDYIDYDARRLGDEVVVQRATIADVFSAAGYQTALFGKLHLTPFLAPSEYGFQESFAVWRENRDTMDRWTGPYYGFDYCRLGLGHGPLIDGHHHSWIRGRSPETVRAVQAASKSPDIPALPDCYRAPMDFDLHPTGWLAGEVDRYLDSVRDADRPFLAFVGIPDPHHPFVPTEEAAEYFDGRPVLGPHDEDGADWDDYAWHRMGDHVVDLSKEERHRVIRYTNAMVGQIDRAVGRILDSLRRHGLYDDTVVVFTSDHGDFLGDHGFLRKGAGAAHALLHTPLLLRVPGRTGGDTVNRPVSNVDVLPTLAEICGVPLPEPVHGRELSAIGGYAFAYCSGGTPETTNHTVYDATHRYTLFPQTGRRELFDHVEDPWEATNLALRDSSAVRGKIDELDQVLKEAMALHYQPTNGRVSAY